MQALPHGICEAMECCRAWTHVMLPPRSCMPSASYDTKHRECNQHRNGHAWLIQWLDMLLWLLVVSFSQVLATGTAALKTFTLKQAALRPRSTKTGVSFTYWITLNATFTYKPVGGDWRVQSVGHAGVDVAGRHSMPVLTGWEWLCVMLWYGSQKGQCDQVLKWVTHRYCNWGQPGVRQRLPTYAVAAGDQCITLAQSSQHHPILAPCLHRTTPS